MLLCIGIFYEDLLIKQCDIEVVQFCLFEGFLILFCIESGGEGCNFEFCMCLVFFDLFWELMIVEQCIGCFDCIGCQIFVEICYFRLLSGFGVEIVVFYECFGFFEKLLGGFNVVFGKLFEVIGKVVFSGLCKCQVDFDKVMVEVEVVYDEMQCVVYQEFYCDLYCVEFKEEILEWVFEDFDEIIEDVIVGVCYVFGFQIELYCDGFWYLIEFNLRVCVDLLLGFVGEYSFFGIFQCEVVFVDEGIDFFVIGYLFVDGLFVYIVEDDIGCVVLLCMNEEDEVDKGFGFFVIYLMEDGYEGYVVDQCGKECFEWCDCFMECLFKCQKVKIKEWMECFGWEQVIEKMGKFIEGCGMFLVFVVVCVG